MQRLELGREHVSACERPTNSFTFRRPFRHPCLALEPFRPIRHDPDHATDAGQALRRNTRRTRERMRPAPGATRHAKAIEAQLVGEQKHIVDLVGNTAATSAV